MASKNAALSQLEETLDVYFGKKAPQLPDNIRAGIVKFSPWLALIGILLSLPAVFALMGINSLYGPGASIYGPALYQALGPTYWISNAILVISLVLEALAIPGLFAKSKKGWRLVYYATLVSIVSSLVAFNIVGAILTALIGFYFLFQIKSYYK